MAILKEFKEFAVEGNAIDLAVGVVIGAGFSKIVDSLVNDIIMPPLSLLVGNIDFSRQALTLKQATTEAPAVTLNYGQFINIVIEFLIIAFSIFLVVKYMNRLRKKEKKKQKKKA